MSEFFHKLRIANIERQKAWDSENIAGPLSRSLELVVEALNEVKKLEQEKLGFRGKFNETSEKDNIDVKL